MKMFMIKLSTNPDNTYVIEAKDLNDLMKEYGFYDGDQVMEVKFKPTHIYKDPKVGTFVPIPKAVSKSKPTKPSAATRAMRRTFGPE